MRLRWNQQYIIKSKSFFQNLVSQFDIENIPPLSRYIKYIAIFLWPSPIFYFYYSTTIPQAFQQ